jgi:enoyl-[acyl-carrier protein] reductase I
VRVNVISAGPIDTLAARGISGFTSMKDESGRRAPLGRGITLDDVGGTAVYLASGLASGVTGQTVYVDCGFSSVV